MNRLDKGDYGYLNQYKRNKLFVSLILAAMIAFIVITTIVMFGDTSRVSIIFAILLSLPFAKFIIAYFLCARFKSIEKAVADKISDAAGAEYVMYDVVVAQYEGMRHYSAIAVKNGRIYALVYEKDYTNKENPSRREYEEWLKECANDSKYNYPVKLYEDTDDYIHKLSTIGVPNDNTRLVDKHIMQRIKDSSI